MHFNATFTSPVSANVRQTVGEHLFQRWLALDHILAQLWESHSIGLALQYYALLKEEKDTRDCMGCLLPETTGRRVVDLVNGYGVR